MLRIIRQFWVGLFLSLLVLTGSCSSSPPLTATSPLNPLSQTGLVAPSNYRVTPLTQSLSQPKSALKGRLRRIYVGGNTTVIDHRDLALALAFRQLQVSDAHQLAQRANQLMGSTLLSGGSINPVPNAGNLDYADPVGFDTVDLALMLATLELGGAASTAALADRVNRILSTTTFTASQIQVVPTQGVPAGLPPIGVPQSINGELTTTDPQLTDQSFYDAYRLVNYPVNSPIEVTMRSTQFNAYLYLVDGDTGNIIFSDNDSGGGTDAFFAFMVDQPGANLRILANSAFAGETGAYTLTTVGSGQPTPTPSPSGPPTPTPSPGSCIPNGVPDTDGDRLADCAETNTGTFVSASNAGTNPNNPDSDGDGISDGDEVLGTLAGLNLPAFGVSPVHKNLLLEHDWFEDNSDGNCTAHSHRPPQAALNLVTTAFANAAISNPDGVNGITMIHDYGQGGAFTGGNQITSFVNANIQVSFDLGGDFQTIKQANFDSQRLGYFHYVLHAHTYNGSGSSGLAELPGNDLIVSLQCTAGFTSAGAIQAIGNTIMHELGHNLGLRHGGFENCNYKPNYNSIMNYAFQFPGIDTDCDPFGDGITNYSVGSRVNLDENNINENIGLCGTVPFDWSGNGQLESGLIGDLNDGAAYNNGNPVYTDFEVSDCGGIQTVLQDHNDWDNIDFSGIGDNDGVSLRKPEVIFCNNPYNPNQPRRELKWRWVPKTR